MTKSVDGLEILVQSAKNIDYLVQKLFDEVEVGGLAEFKKAYLLYSQKKERVLMKKDKREFARYLALSRIIQVSEQLENDYEYCINRITNITKESILRIDKILANHLPDEEHNQLIEKLIEKEKQKVINTIIFLMYKEIIKLKKYKLTSGWYFTTIIPHRFNLLSAASNLYVMHNELDLKWLVTKLEPEHFVEILF